MNRAIARDLCATTDDLGKLYYNLALKVTAERIAASVDKCDFTRQFVAYWPSFLPFSAIEVRDALALLPVSLQQDLPAIDSISSSLCNLRRRGRLKNEYLRSLNHGYNFYTKTE